jgi:hypothetical protein
MLFGHAYFLDDSDETSLGEHLIADAKASELLPLSLLALLDGSQEGEVEKRGDRQRVGERQQ